MRRKHRKGGTPIISPTPPVLTLAQYCPDLENWPRSWRFENSDVAPGQRIVEYFTPFLRHLLAQGLAPKTLRRHRDNLWMLGGDIIRRRQQDPSLRRHSVEKLVFDLIEVDGPLIGPQISEQEQDSLNATCRKFYRFLTTSKLDQSP